MKLKYLSLICSIGFFNIYVHAAELAHLSDEQFEMRLKLFAQECGVEVSISDEDFKEVQLEMIDLSLKQKFNTKYTKSKKNKKKSYKTVRPDNFDQDLYFLVRIKIDQLNQENILDIKDKLEARIKSADAVLIAGNRLPQDVLLHLKTINKLLDEIKVRCALFEKEEKRAKQQEREFSEKIKKWTLILNSIVDSMRSVLQEKKEIVLYKGIEKANKLLLKNLKKSKDLMSRFISLQSKIPAIIELQNSDVKELIKEFSLDYEKLDSMFNPTLQTIDNMKEFINILHDVNSLVLQYQKESLFYFSDSNNISIEDVKLFNSQIKNNIVFLDKKIDKLKLKLSKLSFTDFNRKNIEKIILGIENTRDIIEYYLNVEIKKKYFKENSECCFDCFLRDEFKIGRGGIKSFKESVAKYLNYDPYFEISENFLKENKYLAQDIYCMILKKIKFFNKLISKSIIREVSVEKDKKSFDDDDHLLDNVDESFEKVEFEKESQHSTNSDDRAHEFYEDLKCGSDHDNFGDNLGEEFPEFTEF